jgi:hypothetical protein
MMCEFRNVKDVEGVLIGYFKVLALLYIISGSGAATCQKVT